MDGELWTFALQQIPLVTLLFENLLDLIVHVTYGVLEVDLGLTRFCEFFVEIC